MPKKKIKTKSTTQSKHAVKSTPNKKERDKPTFKNASEALTWLQNKWTTSSPKSKQAFSVIEDALANICLPCFGARESNILDLLKQVLLTHDKKFLGKQITYHISASSNLPTVCADPDKLTPSFEAMLDYLVKKTPRTNSISIKLEGYPLRSQPGVKCSFSINDPNIKKSDETEILAEAFVSPEVSELAKCRQSFARLGGQLWMEMPSSHTLELNFVLPSSASETPPEKQEAFRYDIIFSNYPSIRKRFGKKKALYLLREVERYIKSSVRYPFDIVVASPDKGMITTIYETPLGASRSVASRISHKLGSEHFQIGKYTITIDFRYELKELA